MGEGIELDRIIRIDRREHHHLIEPPYFRGHLDELREKVDVPLRVDDDHVVPFSDVLLDDVLDEPRLPDAGGPEESQVAASLPVGNRDGHVLRPVGQIDAPADDRLPEFHGRPVLPFSFLVDRDQSIETHCLPSFFGILLPAQKDDESPIKGTVSATLRRAPSNTRGAGRVSSF